ncbi:MAG: hypothetical protein MI976_29090 [Pseudomonadales bacterium]|nr:hypothetical protein [Pseudomonadales bacterium]
MSVKDGRLEIDISNVSLRLVVTLLIISAHGVLVLFNVEIPTFDTREIELIVDIDSYQLQVIFWLHVFSIIFSAFTPTDYSGITNSFIAGAFFVAGCLYLFTLVPFYGFLMTLNAIDIVGKEYKKREKCLTSTPKCNNID